jgi:tRNA (cmo5U34)-methyltransferase
MSSPIPRSGARDRVEWNPDTYLDAMLAEVPSYLELQEHVAEATRDIDAESILELGIGTGETTRRVLEHHPGARLTAIDSSAAMLDRARAVYPDVDLRLAALEEPLPDGPFDLVFSALVVHHLDGSGKRDLFRRIADVLAPDGRFVLGDVVVPEREEDSQIPIDWEMDLPDRVDDQLEWLQEAGFEAEVRWTFKDLAVISAVRWDRTRGERA